VSERSITPRYQSNKEYDSQAKILSKKAYEKTRAFVNESSGMLFRLLGRDKQRENQQQKGHVRK
jgi:hypothetical protein